MSGYHVRFACQVRGKAECGGRPFMLAQVAFRAGATKLLPHLAEQIYGWGLPSLVSGQVTAETPWTCVPPLGPDSVDKVAPIEVAR